MVNWDLVVFLLVVFSCAWTVTYFLTPVCMLLAHTYGFLDYPSERRVHSSVVPRNGGIAIFSGVLLAVVLAYLFGSSSVLGDSFARDVRIFFVAAFVLLLVGLYDDLKSISPIAKLLGQILSALILWVYGIQIDSLFGFGLPLFLNIFVSILWFVFIVNAFNLIDGYDGLASGLGVIASIGIAGTLIYRSLFPELVLVVAITGACLAFLIYNRHPARIFLGDSGSMFIGFLLAYVTAKTSNKGPGFLAVWIPVLAMSVPVTDVLLAFWRRFLRNLNSFLFRTSKSASIFGADMEHLHHRLQNLGVNQHNVTACLCLGNAILILVSFLSLLARDWGLALWLGTICILVVILLRYVVKLELWESGIFIVHSLGARTKPLLAVVIYSFLDLIGLAFFLFVALWCANPYDQFDSIVSYWSSSILLWCGLPLVFLMLADLLRTCTPITPALHKLIKTIDRLIAMIIPVVFLILLKYDGANRNLAFVVTYMLLFLGYYFLLRSFPHFVEQWMRQRSR